MAHAITFTDEQIKMLIAGAAIIGLLILAAIGILPAAITAVGAAVVQIVVGL